MDALDSTKGRDMIYTISVQGHRKVSERTGNRQILEIKVLSAPTEELKVEVRILCQPDLRIGSVRRRSLTDEACEAG